jgi:hypothetical protein
LIVESLAGSLAEGIEFIEMKEPWVPEGLLTNIGDGG